jgi:hypothetical protein
MRSIAAAPPTSRVGNPADRAVQAPNSRIARSALVRRNSALKHLRGEIT